MQALVLSKPLPVVDKVFRKLLINVPPGTMKSLIASVFLPAWVWLNKPGWKCIFAANAKIAVRDSIKCRDLIRSDWYQKTFKPDWQLSSDQDAKKLFKNTAQGFRLAVAVGEDITGERADHLGIDDPLDAADAPSKLKRDSIAYWLDQAFQNRVVSPAHSTTHMIMQRLHEEDPSGHVLEQGGYYHICLPMEFETARKDIFDPRTIEGELLFPERFPQFVLDEQKIILGPYGYAGQMQQNPMPATKSLSVAFLKLQSQDVNRSSSLSGSATAGISLQPFGRAPICPTASMLKKRHHSNLNLPPPAGMGFCCIWPA